MFDNFSEKKNYLNHFRYYWAAPNLGWVEATTWTVLDVPGALSITVHDGHVGCLGYVTRYNVSGKQTIGYMWNKGRDLLYWTGTAGASTPLNTIVFEVLACT